MDSDKKVDNATQNAPTSASAQASKTDEAQSAEKLTIDSGYVAAKSTEKDMSAIFGTLHNNSDKDIEIKSFDTDLPGKATYQLHEVVDGTMRERTTPMVVPAGGTMVLEPGKDHLMIMDYKAAIEPGTQVMVKAKLADGSTANLGKLEVRSQSADQENYGSNGSMTMENGMDNMKDMKDMKH